MQQRKKALMGWGQAGDRIDERGAPRWTKPLLLITWPLRLWSVKTLVRIMTVPRVALSSPSTPVRVFRNTAPLSRVDLACEC